MTDLTRPVRDQPAEDDLLLFLGRRVRDLTAERDALRATVDRVRADAFDDMIELLDNVLPTYTEDQQVALRSFRAMLTVLRRALDGATQAAPRADPLTCPPYTHPWSECGPPAAQGVPLTEEDR